MASLNKGIFIDNPNIDKDELKENIKRIFKNVKDVNDVMFFTDEELSSIAITLSNAVKAKLSKEMADVDGVIPIDKEGDDSIFSDPEFIKRFNSTLVININPDSHRVSKFVFVDRSNAVNISDTSLIECFAKLTQVFKHDMTLHIPTSSSEKAQVECFYDSNSNNVTIENIAIGAPAIGMYICTKLSEAELSVQEDKANDKKISTVLFPYGSIAEMYDEMLAFILDTDTYDTIYLGISDKPGDKPVLKEVNNFKELYATLCEMHKQIELYGVLSSSVVDLN